MVRQRGGDCGRCKCRSKSTGARCKNKTCKFLPCCWAHTRNNAAVNVVADTRLISGLYVARSTIPGAGCGLFTRAKITKGTNIGLYSGPKVAPGRRAAYDMQCFQGRSSVDASGKDTKFTSALRYANSGAGTNLSANVRIGKMVQLEGNNIGCNIKARRNIPANAEIIVPYGSGYRGRGVGPPSTKCKSRRIGGRGALVALSASRRKAQARQLEQKDEKPRARRPSPRNPKPKLKAKPGRVWQRGMWYPSIAAARAARAKPQNPKAKSKVKPKTKPRPKEKVSRTSKGAVIKSRRSPDIPASEPEDSEESDDDDIFTL